MEEFDNAARLHIVPKDPWLWKNLNETSTVVWGFLFLFSPKIFQSGCHRSDSLGSCPESEVASGGECLLGREWGRQVWTEGVAAEVRSPEVYLILQDPSEITLRWGPGLQSSIHHRCMWAVPGEVGLTLGMAAPSSQEQ